MAESRRICVSFGNKTKLFFLNTSDIDETVHKIKDKFEITVDVHLQAKCEGISKFVDIDVDDSDDREILKDCSELLVRAASTSTEPVASPESVVSPDSVSSLASPVTSQAKQEGKKMERASKGRLNLNIQEVLQESLKGSQLLEEYDRNNTLSPQSRQLLVKIITAELVKVCHIPYYPSAEEKTECARAIIEKFPSLQNKHSRCGYEHFFCAQGKQTGYIQDRLKNMRRYLPGVAKKRSSLSTLSQSTPKVLKLHVDNTPSQPIPEEEQKQLASFCKIGTPDLKRDIKDAMSKLYGSRQKWIQEVHPTVTDILTEYPRFIDIDELVNQDFRQHFGDGASNQLLLKWETDFLPGIWKLAEQTTTTAMQKLYEEAQEESSSDLKAMYSFLFLVLLLPANSKFKGAKNQALDLLIDFQPVGESVEVYLMKEKKQKQPYLLCFGNRKAPSQFFIIVDKKAIQCYGNIVAAIDKLFKLHFIFNLEYAGQLKLFYEFLEMCVYDISTVGKMPSKIVEVRSAVEVYGSQKTNSLP